MSNLIRVFRAVAKPGREAAFQSFFTGEAVSIVRRFPGLVSVTVGLPSDSAPREFLMITTWRDLDSLKEFTGESWKEAVVKPEEAPLLDEVIVHHYLEAEIQ